MKKLLTSPLLGLACVMASTLSHGDLAVPGWYTEGAASWHYRVPITLPGSAAVNSTVHLDVNFNALLGNLGVNAGAVNFDENSVRVVRPNNSLAATQEFSDTVFNGVFDAVGDSQGEVRFLLEDTPGAGTYYLYFDILANGTKPGNPSAVINGNFEHSAGSIPTSWVTSAVNAGGAQNNEVYRTNISSTINLAAGCNAGAVNGLDTSPNNNGTNTTGEAWHLLGYRTNCEDGSGNEQIRLSRNISVPSGGAAGTLTFFFQVQAHDGISNNNNYDWFEFRVNGAVVNHNALSINNASAPALRIDNNRLGRNGYADTLNDYGWKQATLNLAAFAGSNINFRIQSRHSASDNSYRTWMKIDDVTWSRQNATLGDPEGFGINLVAPDDTSVSPVALYVAGQTLVISAVSNAQLSSITADVIDQSAVVIATGINLFDDGSHGDLVAGDNTYTNDGSNVADPTYTLLLTDPPGTGWFVRVFGFDASTSSIGASNGLIHRPGQPNTPEILANFFNIDEQLFTVLLSLLEIDKTYTTVRDPVTATTNPKAIPGAWIQYDLVVSNQGPDATDAGTVIILDDLPVETSLCITNVCSGFADAVEYDDLASPTPTGLVWNFATDVAYSVDGLDFTYSGVPDAAGFDPLIRFIRVIPTGSMNGTAVSGDPEFFIRYVVRLD